MTLVLALALYMAASLYLAVRLDWRIQTKS